MDQFEFRGPAHTFFFFFFFFPFLRFFSFFCFSFLSFFLFGYRLLDLLSLPSSTVLVRLTRDFFFSRFRFFAVAVAVAVVVVVVVVVVERMDFRWHSSAARATTAVGATPQKRSNRS